MATSQRKLRERVFGGHRLTAGWSYWQKALVPLDDDLEHRGNPKQVGLMCSSIKYAFLDEVDCCGIYEWKAVGTSFRGQPDHVVYIGSTCRSKPGGLKRRILEYCTNGSHNEELINEALNKGYELWVRIKVVSEWPPRKEDAEEMENDLLDRYDDAWNVRNNGRIRDILP